MTGSITSRCSGNEPVLLPERAAGHVCLPLLLQPIRLLLADFRLAMLSHKLSYQNKMVDSVERLNAAYELVLVTFKIENLKGLQREALKKLVSGLDVFVVQSALIVNTSLWPTVFPSMNFGEFFHPL